MKTQFAIKKMFLLIGITLMPVLLAACTTGASYHPNITSNQTNGPLVRSSTPASKILITSQSVDRPYQTIGTINAYHRILNLFSSDPTKADVNEELRAEAAKYGADAVIQVTYAQERTGFRSNGKMKGSGLAIVYLQSKK